ncbi:hypothetical protein BH11CYA1_BH11CYA1_35010 [soil metagenome]
MSTEPNRMISRPSDLLQKYDGLLVKHNELQAELDGLAYWQLSAREYLAQELLALCWRKISRANRKDATSLAEHGVLLPIVQGFFLRWRIWRCCPTVESEALLVERVNAELKEYDWHVKLSGLLVPSFGVFTRSTNVVLIYSTSVFNSRQSSRLSSLMEADANSSKHRHFTDFRN